MWKETTGEGVVVAVVNSGCDLTHPDLENNLLPGYNAIDPRNPPEDDENHGSFVTGVICAEHNAIGIIGIAPNAKVRPVKVIDENGEGTIRHVVKGIRWAVEQKVDFISLSLGTPKPTNTLRKAIKMAYQANIPIFAAAGNMGTEGSLLYPANFKTTISVAAVTKELTIADFDNVGRNLDLLAPGVDIFSTVTKHAYATMSGSSAAQPFVCGLAALLLSYCRKHNNTSLGCVEDFREFFQRHSTGLNQLNNGKRLRRSYRMISTDGMLDSLR